MSSVEEAAAVQNEGELAVHAGDMKPKILTVSLPV